MIGLEHQKRIPRLASRPRLKYLDPNAGSPPHAFARKSSHGTMRVRWSICVLVLGLNIRRMRGNRTIEKPHLKPSGPSLPVGQQIVNPVLNRRRQKTKDFYRCPEAYFDSTRTATDLLCKHAIDHQRGIVVYPQFVNGFSYQLAERRALGAVDIAPGSPQPVFSCSKSSGCM